MKNFFFIICLFISSFAYARGGVTVKTLETGQKLIVSEDKSLPVCYLYMVLKNGAIWDPKELEGLTSITSEMLMRGTTTRTREQIRDELDILGAEIDIEAGQEGITIVGQTLTRNLDPFLAIFSDVILHPSFDSKELAKLKREVISQLKQMRENDQALVGRFFIRSLFKGHPYGMSSDGKESTVQKITENKVKDFYRKLFVGNNALFAASGDLNEFEISKKITQAFKDLPKGKSVSFQYPPSPIVKGKEIILIDKPARTQTQIMIGHVGIQVLDPDYFPLLIANNAFGGGFTARLMQEVRVKRGWSYGSYSWFRARKTPGEFAMMAFPGTKDTVETLKLMLSLYEDYAAKGITQEEFNLSKNNLINEFPFKIDTARKKVSQLILMELMGLPSDYLDTYRKRLEKVTLEEVNQAIQKHADSKNLFIAILCTAKEFKNKLTFLGKDTKITIKKYTDD
ncbi:MAG: hypothetical protein A2Z91_01060 [Deltaproteobacteria bacterium GWA2_38_16]|nr:MAG: hypothetical protein A2Z91_01060 [Deltaproteobacteria bacterium GWA2_38_16]OGQ02968.1 MAG: hypothetical protein A3D19_00970 [Deltaproteobacteria bacterium RIFCSPHIGHO2_02_FULL_38_15]OGQ34511.1 MAG: hypothetical protein A3A72_05110 [Deltaproteobacteria bacterium RIFCSPLOWO2_01_FULL_38_9]OGQ59211.1 MAG: hypothetical protein A3G92_06845 [Deltaproteobacteria bacterium RIFCSPLOWO2_12_FULL_38_8]HBQ21931.1 hypothetical protein [Deltaproteobacteria bacterium]